MSESFRLQDPGEGIHEAQILEVRITEGDSISEGDELFVVETDKAAVEVPSPFTGTIDEVCVSKGERVAVGDVLVTYSTSGEKSDGAGGEAASEEEPEQRAGDKEGKAQSNGGDTKDNEQADNGDKRAKQQGESGEKEERNHGDGKERESDRGKADQDHAAAAPATRKLADKLGVDIEKVDGSGPDGRIEPKDVRAAADESESTTGRTGGDENGELPDFSRWGDVETVDLTAIRRRIAQRMQRSWRTVPHVMHGDKFDITRLEKVRSKHKDDFEQQGGKLTITVFALKAVALALQDFPRFNASLDGDGERLVLKHYCHIGVAVDTDDGLLVPVVRNVDQQSLAELSVEVVRLAKRARAGELDADEMRGGSITITNPGAIGGSMFTPIINYPEVAIVGLGAAREEPALVDGDTVENRLMLPLTVSFDHRVNDGADAARFTDRIGALMTSPADMLLEA